MVGRGIGSDDLIIRSPSWYTELEEWSQNVDQAAFIPQRLQQEPGGGRGDNMHNETEQTKTPALLLYKSPTAQQVNMSPSPFRLHSISTAPHYPDSER